MFWWSVIIVIHVLASAVSYLVFRYQWHLDFGKYAEWEKHWGFFLPLSLLGVISLAAAFGVLASVKFKQKTGRSAYHILERERNNWR